MAIVHKLLTDPQRWTETIHHYTYAETDTSVRFATGSYSEEYDGDVLHTGTVELGEYGYMINLGSYGGDPATYNRHVNAGLYKVNVDTGDANATYSIYKLTADGYVDQGALDKIGDFEDGDTVQLVDGDYMFASADYSGDYTVYLVEMIQSDNPEYINHETFTETTISEPIGFDKLQMEMKRHDYHGIGAEVSAGSLEFYGNAFDIITGKYNTDIDSEVLYDVTMDGERLYRGQLDFTTLSIKRSDYQSVSVKVGEIGVKTTFNNHTDTDIDLNIPKTIGGASVDSPTWQRLLLPYKRLLHANVSTQSANASYTAGGGSSSANGIHITDQLNENQNQTYIYLPIGDNETNEFGTFQQQNPPYTTDHIFDVDPQYYYSEDHVDKYGSNTEYSLDISLDITVGILSDIPASLDFGWDKLRSDVRFRLYAAITWGDTDILGANSRLLYTSDVGAESGTTMFKFRLQASGLRAESRLRYYLRCTAGNFDRLCSVTVLKGSYVKMVMQDNLQTTANSVSADSILIHDALNVVSHAISENALEVASIWYGSPDSRWKAEEDVGGGACKAITNGYHIRGLFTDAGNQRNMPMSFKALIESLSALDCIGWGFSTEDGKTCIRVERWDWFYKNTVLLNLTNVAEVTTEVYVDQIPTELAIGYKKYATVEQYNSIDSPHGTRTFVSGIKAVSKQLNKMSEFIADNYAIEETRRARFQKNPTEETTYDASVFVLELLRNGSNGTYTIGHTAYNAQNVGEASEFINAKLTPRHMAARWRSFLFSTNNTTPFRFTTGELNYKASFNCVPHQYVDANNVLINSLASLAVSSPQVENENLTYTPAKFKAEKITFTYPLTLAQYNTIKANPYGLIGVNGSYGWILDFKYELSTGKANFTLIAKR